MQAERQEDGEREAPPKAGYRRSTGSARGEARRRELLESVTDDLAVNGLVDFSLRRAARAANTTHKVLLYYFDGVEDLLEQAVLRLRERRIANALAAIPEQSSGETLGARMRAIWPVLADDSSGLRVIDQAIGLAMYDPVRYGHLGRDSSLPYLPVLESLLPQEWSEQRRTEVSQFVLALMCGFLLLWRTNADAAQIDAAIEAMVRALDREERSGVDSL